MTGHGTGNVRDSVHVLLSVVHKVRGSASRVAGRPSVARLRILTRGVYDVSSRAGVDDVSSALARHSYPRLRPCCRGTTANAAARLLFSIFKIRRRMAFSLAARTRTCKVTIKSPTSATSNDNA